MGAAMANSLNGSIHLVQDHISDTSNILALGHFVFQPFPRIVEKRTGGNPLEYHGSGSAIDPSGAP